MAININPFTHAINILRDLILFGAVERNYLIFVIMLFAVMGGIGFIWASRGLKKELDL